MTCTECQENCQCRRKNAVNIFSADYKAGQTVGRLAEGLRTTDALLELERSGVITNAQMQAILDLILEKLTYVMDVD